MHTALDGYATVEISQERKTRIRLNPKSSKNIISWKVEFISNNRTYSYLIHVIRTTRKTVLRDKFSRLRFFDVFEMELFLS